MDAPFKKNKHLFELAPSAAASLSELRGRARLKRLERIIRGEEPGWYCGRCGLGIGELYEVAEWVGELELLSTLVVQCDPAPRTVRARLGEQLPGELVYTSLTRQSDRFRQAMTESMLEIIGERSGLVPVLTPSGAVQRYIRL